MMKMKTKYSELWEQLEREVSQKHTSQTLVRRIIPESNLDVYIGIVQPDNKRAFALEVNSTLMDDLEELPVFKGLDIVKRDAISDKPDRASLFVILKGSRFADLFSILIEDIATELLAIRDEQQALSLTVTRLVEWQQFAQQGDKDGLSEEAQRGLYGELYLLLHHLLPNMGPRGVMSWKGFSANQQDFYIGKTALEVKTAIAKQHQKLSISSERQLDGAFFDKLYLYHLSMDEVQQSSHTLPAIVQDIQHLLKSDPQASQYFDDGLYEAGYLDEHAKMYKLAGYEIREENLFTVEGEFPRIVEKDLRLGVGDVKYSINVAECKHFKTELSVIAEVAKGNSSED